MKNGFTMIEMVAVLLILAILAAAVTGGLSKARDRAWRTQARETCHQLAQAWNAYLVDERKFPDGLGTGEGVLTEYDKIKYLVGEVDSGRVYLELTDKEKEGKAQGGGLRDPWRQLFSFTLDLDYDGLVKNPYPDAFVDEGDDSEKYKKVRASSIVWSEGNPKRANRKDNPIVVW